MSPRQHEQDPLSARGGRGRSSLPGHRTWGCWVDGATWNPDGLRRLSVVDPANGQAFASIPVADESAVDRTVAVAREALAEPAWSTRTPSEREGLLHRLATRMEEVRQELIDLIVSENGKLKSAATREVDGAIRFTRYAAGWATRISGETMNPSFSEAHRGTFAYTLREPVGVVAGITPWNFPLGMSVWKSIPALACGCTVILKPSELTPLSALKLAELASEVGTPPGVLNVVTGDGVTGAALVRHEGVAKVAFTGSSAVGRSIGAAAGQRLARFSLELGGKSPALVFADADLDRAAVQVAKGIFYNQGQVCAAGSRLYVEASVFEPFLARLQEQAASMRLGPGWMDGVDMGPLVSEGQRDRVATYVREAVTGGARVRCGAETVARDGFFYPPTILTDLSQDARIVQEEVFGPVLIAAPFESATEAVELANDSAYGLAACIYSENASRVQSLIPRLNVGSVFVNTAARTDPALPMGGVGDSGIGREHGSEMVRLYTELKTVVISYAELKSE